MAAVLAIGYANEGTAARAAEEIRDLRLGLEPDAVAIIARNSDGGYHSTTTHHPVEQGDSWGMFWGLLFGLLFFVPVFGIPVGLDLGGVFGKIEKAGINRAFQQQVRDMVPPGSAALFVFVGKTSTERAVARLGKLAGQVVEVSLSDEQEARLRRAIHGSLSAPAS